MTTRSQGSHESWDAEGPRTNADEERTDAAIQDFNSRVQWPRRPEDTHGLSTPPPPDPIPLRSTQSRAARSGWRTFGLGALGFLGGVLLGIIVQDILAHILIRTSVAIPSPIFALIIPVFATLGVVVAILLTNRTVKH